MAEHIDANLNGHVAIDSCEFQRMFIQFLSEDVNTVSNPIAVNRKYPANDIIVYSNDYFAQMRAYSSSIIKNIFSNVFIYRFSCIPCNISWIVFIESCFLSIFLPKTEEHPRFADCLSFIFNQEHERDNCICENCNSKLVIHIGTLDDAHFVAVLKDKKKFNRWFLYNDEKREK
uniref:Uncharacterized protein n=1 Tax=Meloidogyne enterolobii TaxID=390850 RepID=A0A6V7UWV5_MELEN|nr:unnamed protein product [Meloidogyne enterolobii]